MNSGEAVKFNLGFLATYMMAKCGRIIKGGPFLSEPHHIGLMLNCDWFQPFNQSQYSVGVLYLVILNLPRAIRFKPKNIIIAAIIPDPKEPRAHEMNSYLRPLVITKVLNALWAEGFQLNKASHAYAALIAIQQHKNYVNLLVICIGVAIGRAREAKASPLF